MKNKTQNPLVYLAKLTLEQPALTLQSIILLILMATVNLPLPLLNKIAIDHAIPAGDTWPLVYLGLLAFFVRAVASGFQVLQNHVMWKLLGGITHRLRVGMTDAILSSNTKLAADGVLAGYVGRISSEIESLETTIFDSFRFIVRPIAMISVMAMVMFSVSWQVTTMILVLTPISVFAIRSMTAKLSEQNKRLLKLRGIMQTTVTEQLENIRVIRVNTQEERSRELMNQNAKLYSEASVAYATRQQLVQSVSDIINFIPWLVLVAIGAHLVHSKELSTGDFLMFISFDQLLRSPVGQLCVYLLQLKAEMSAPERIEEVLAIENEDGDKTIPFEKNKDKKGNINIVNLDFNYENSKPIFSDLNLSISSGERVALVGPSGAGKTTFFSLLLGFQKPVSGTIRIDNEDLIPGHLKSLRSRIGVVFQHNPMFDMSIRENLILNRNNISDDDISDVLKRTDLELFINTLPSGLDTEIGVRGLKLSGGQRQRLAIARAMLGKPDIILLDEATSSLDSISEQQIGEALKELLKGKTSLTIAHRLSTILNSDRILYLNKGRICESGTHQELLHANGAYAKLYNLQLGNHSIF
jgi:ATP-binding cassette, subfamily B, bacterial AbcA/BmrA